jgi:cell division protein FtsB
LERRTSGDPHLGQLGRFSSGASPRLGPSAVRINGEHNITLAIFCDSVYKQVGRPLFEKIRNIIMGKKGAMVLLAIVIAYAWIAVSGPQGLQALMEKRHDIRELQEQNSALTREIEHRRDRIRRLEDSPSEQEMEIRKQLKLLKPGETTFILPDGPKDSGK